jgi:hypothetical protein
MTAAPQLASMVTQGENLTCRPIAYKECTPYFLYFLKSSAGHILDTAFKSVIYKTVCSRHTPSENFDYSTCRLGGEVEDEAGRRENAGLLRNAILMR